MEPRLLFPSKFRYLGYLLAIPGFILGYITMYHNALLSGLVVQLHAEKSFTGNVIELFTNELALAMVIIGLLLIAFSKVKREDELTARIRIYALYWAILVNYILYTLLFSFVIICDVLNINIGSGLLGSSSYLLIIFPTYNLFTPLVIFNAIFYYQLFSSKNEFVVKPIKYLPNKPYRFISKWLSVIFFSLLFINSITKYEVEMDNLSIVLYLLPLILMVWAYSKEKDEDEYIGKIRLEAMQVAVYVNYAILLLSNFLFYGGDFWTVEDINLLTIPVIFIAWFQYRLYRINKQTETKSIAS